MEDITESEKQRRHKYRDHDIVMDDLKPMDIEHVRGAAIRGFVETKRGDNVELIVEAFMGFLTSRGYRIVKESGCWKRELDADRNEVNVLYDGSGLVVRREYPKFEKKEKP